jgi:single-strand DNA-binding protein
MNTVTITGRLGRDPKLITDTDTDRAHFTLAVDNRNSEHPDWIPVVVFGSYAKHITKHIAKGHLVGVEGRLATARGADANGEAYTYINVIADRVDFLARPKAASGATSDHPADYAPAEEPF